MKFEWELIGERRGGGVSDITLRAKTIGGWLVKLVYCDDSSCLHKSIREHVLTFVPDPQHEWEISNA